jgi:hypothetical protein
MICGVQFAVVVDGGASKPAPFACKKGAKDPAPGKSKSYVEVVWKGRPPAVSYERSLKDSANSAFLLSTIFSSVFPS